MCPINYNGAQYNTFKLENDRREIRFCIDSVEQLYFCAEFL